MAKKAKVKSKLLGLLNDFDNIKKKFYKKVEQEGFEESVSENWWNKISSQASYSFALSHCLPGKVKIATGENEYKTVKEIFEDENIKEILTYNKKSKTYEKDLIEKKMDSGILDIYKITTEDGKEIECSSGERFLTEKGWKRLDELKEGDEVYVRK